MRVRAAILISAVAFPPLARSADRPPPVRVCPGNQVRDLPVCRPDRASAARTLEGYKVAYLGELAAFTVRPGEPFVPLVEPHTGACPVDCRHRGERCDDPWDVAHVGYSGWKTRPTPGD